MNDFIALAKSRLYISSIVACHNVTVNAYNNDVSHRVVDALGVEFVALEAHETVSSVQSQLNFATNDFMLNFMLNFEEDDSIPPHFLRLFVGAPVFLVRNFLPSRGLVNGAKFIIVEILLNHIKAVNITHGSPFFGESEIFFRFSFPVQGTGFAFSRRQYPFKLAFASTVHKLQGDTVLIQGYLLIDAQASSFCHAQMYVAFTRAQASRQLITVCPESQELIHCVTLQALVQEDPRLLCGYVDELDEEPDDENPTNFFARSLMDWSNAGGE